MSAEVTSEINSSIHYKSIEEESPLMDVIDDGSITLNDEEQYVEETTINLDETALIV
jgi:hypothetical protein